MRWIRNIVGYLICAIASVAMVHWVESTVVVDLLVPNLTAMVVALLAINVQTTAVISVKLRELADKHGCSFGSTAVQFKLAMLEQFALVLVSLAISAVSKSKFASTGTLAVEVATFFTIYAALHIFVDTSISLVVALFPGDDKRDKGSA